MSVLAKATFIARRPTSQIDGVCLCHEGCDAARRAVDLTSIVGEARTINIKSTENLRYRLVKAENDLDMANGIVGHNSDGILGSDSLRQKSNSAAQKQVKKAGRTVTPSRMASRMLASICLIFSRAAASSRPQIKRSTSLEGASR